jgi:hypothetical protein
MNDLLIFAFFSAAIIFLSIFGTIVRSRHAMKAVKAVKEGKTKEEVRGILKSEPDGPAMQIYQRIGKIILVGILIFWSNAWLGVTGASLPVSWQAPLSQCIFGIQTIVAGIVLIRSVLMLVSAFTESQLLDTIADRNSHWETLESRLIMGAFAFTFLGGILPIYFLIKQG